VDRKDAKTQPTTLEPESDILVSKFAFNIQLVPLYSTGTLFRNGPGLLEIFGTKLNQFFDGDGLIYSIAFENGAEGLCTSCIQLRPIALEQRAWFQPLSRGGRGG
jgi:hypothetical protein